MAPRGWWKVDAKRTNTVGVEASFDLIRDVLKKDHYDVRICAARCPTRTRTC